MASRSSFREKTEVKVILFTTALPRYFAMLLKDEYGWVMAFQLLLEAVPLRFGRLALAFGQGEIVGAEDRPKMSISIREEFQQIRAFETRLYRN
jgi:hypothetical protein